MRVTQTLTPTEFRIYANVSDVIWFGDGFVARLVVPHFDDIARQWYCYRCNRLVAERIPDGHTTWDHRRLLCIKCACEDRSPQYSWIIDELDVLNEENDFLSGFCPEELLRAQFQYNLLLYEKADWS